MKSLVGIAGMALVLAAAPASVPILAGGWQAVAGPDVLLRVETDTPLVALTIDDGPSAVTPDILDLLAEHGARATFFVLGEELRRDPAVARRMVREGHELGHHMMVDAPSIEQAPEAFRREFLEMDAILDAFGRTRVFRPGSGWYDDRIVEEAARAGYRTVLGSVYPFDAQLPSIRFASWYIRSFVHPGAIVVLHEGGARGERTVEVLRSILPALRARGIEVVPVSELVARTSSTNASAEGPPQRLPGLAGALRPSGR